MLGVQFGLISRTRKESLELAFKGVDVDMRVRRNGYMEEPLSGALNRQKRFLLAFLGIATLEAT